MNKIQSIIFSIIITLTITLFFLSPAILLMKDDHFCKEVYPSSLEGDYNWLNGYAGSSTERVEPGYIRCCRGYYDKSHEKKQECEIFIKGE